ncbi:MAG: type II toxin-antitoxin system Phd/YefM family antitoxin [Kiritimatiellia bacterium]|jgi:antitoxin YefM|nr:type II toxin-antitoxin system Phd/YefM family antitoxin [Kiritimatiellia bacterium]
MTTLTATDARKGFFDLVKKANEEHEVYHIHHRYGDVVLMSEEEFDSLNETLLLLSSPGFKKAFDESRKQESTGETVAFDEVFGEKQ